MDKRKGDVTQTTAAVYREKIVEMVEKVENLDYLEFPFGELSGEAVGTLFRKVSMEKMGYSYDKKFMGNLL